MNPYRLTGIGLLLMLFMLSGCTHMEERLPIIGGPPQKSPHLGLRMRIIAADNLPKALIDDRAQALQVVRVIPEQPAARAGIESGDILLALDAQPVVGMGDSTAIMKTRQWGDTVVLTVLRGEQILLIKVTLQP
jgi:S1-C subfamily serine protease